MAKTKTSFKKGQGGRTKGSVNQLTRTVKETVLAVFNDLQDDKKYNLTAFAKKYPRDFYTIAAKLIPTEIRGGLNNKTILEIVRRKNITPLGHTASISTNGNGTGEEIQHS